MNPAAGALHLALALDLPALSAAQRQLGDFLAAGGCPPDSAAAQLIKERQDRVSLGLRSVFAEEADTQPVEGLDIAALEQALCERVVERRA